MYCGHLHCRRQRPVCKLARGSCARRGSRRALQRDWCPDGRADLRQHSVATPAADFGGPALWAGGRRRNEGQGVGALLRCATLCFACGAATWLPVDHSLPSSAAQKAPPTPRQPEGRLHACTPASLPACPACQITDCSSTVHPVHRRDALPSKTHLPFRCSAAGHGVFRAAGRKGGQGPAGMRQASAASCAWCGLPQPGAVLHGAPCQIHARSGKRGSAVGRQPSVPHPLVPYPRAPCRPPHPTPPDTHHTCPARAPPPHPRPCPQSQSQPLPTRCGSRCWRCGPSPAAPSWPAACGRWGRRTGATWTLTTRWRQVRAPSAPPRARISLRCVLGVGTAAQRGACCVRTALWHAGRDGMAGLAGSGASCWPRKELCSACNAAAWQGQRQQRGTQAGCCSRAARNAAEFTRLRVGPPCRRRARRPGRRRQVGRARQRRATRALLHPPRRWAGRLPAPL